MKYVKSKLTISVGSITVMNVITRSTITVSVTTIESVGTIELSISNQPYTLSLVSKRGGRKNPPMYFCGIFGVGYDSKCFFECGGCLYPVCLQCVLEILG